MAGGGQTGEQREGQLSRRRVNHRTDSICSDPLDKGESQRRQLEPSNVLTPLSGRLRTREDGWW